jgi:hypothetical protein
MCVYFSSLRPALAQLEERDQNCTVIGIRALHLRFEWQPPRLLGSLLHAHSVANTTPYSGPAYEFSVGHDQPSQFDSRCSIIMAIEKLYTSINQKSLARWIILTLHQ